MSEDKNISTSNYILHFWLKTGGQCVSIIYVCNTHWWLHPSVQVKNVCKNAKRCVCIYATM